jgi:hypothetical protein
VEGGGEFVRALRGGAQGDADEEGQQRGLQQGGVEGAAVPHLGIEGALELGEEDGEVPLRAADQTDGGKPEITVKE